MEATTRHSMKQKSESQVDRMFLASQNKPTPGLGKTTRYLIFFMPGNPGIIAFYRDFLHRLHENLSSNDHAVDLLGISMPGFNLDKYASPPRLPADMDAHATFAEETLYNHVSADPETQYRIILIGHSLGAFQSLQIIQRFRNNLFHNNSRDGKEEPCPPNANIIAAIGITPGIIHLAKSPAAKDLLWLLSIPCGVSVLNAVIKGVCFLLPDSVLHKLLANSNNYPPEHIATSIAWLRSKWGVYESLYLAREEVERIADDRQWDDEVWGAATPSPLPGARARLYFLFGENDDWVDKETRDEFIARRARGGSNDDWKPVMEVDQTGITHDFSIRHSAPVAAKTAMWVEEIISSDQTQFRSEHPPVRAS